jgi:alpha-methylacyl-CoA racemase
MNLETALDGITILEIASYIPGPLCTQILADLGAKVIKIERPGGDPLRQLEPRLPGAENPMFAVFNQGKTHIELDLKSAEGINHLRALVAEADVLVDGFRPGVLDRLGVGAAELQALNPRLIYCAISGYGIASDWAARAGHDLNMLALAGFIGMSTVGGTPAMPATPLADMVSGLTAATAILAALQPQQATGKGTLIDLAMSDVARWLMLPGLAQRRAGLPLGPEERNPLGGGWACYNRYRTADGRYLALGAVEPHFWARFCQAIEQPALIERQFEPQAQGEVYGTVAATIAGKPLAYWLAHFADLDACITPVLNLDEVDQLPQHQQRAFGDKLPI